MFKITMPSRSVDEDPFWVAQALRSIAQLIEAGEREGKIRVGGQSLATWGFTRRAADVETGSGPGHIGRD